VDSLPALELGAVQDPHQTSSGDTVSGGDASPEIDSDQNPQASTDQSSDHATHILELGVGSGAVIVSLLHSLPSATGVGVDVEDDCLALAQANAHTHGVADRLTLQWHDVSAPLPGEFDVVVGNLPYIPDHEWPQSIDPGVLEFTPERALRGGEDGLAIIRPVLGWVGQVMRPNGLLGLEHAACCNQTVADLLEHTGFREVESISDEDGFPRVTFGVWPGKGR
jgi:release factor glutamine methyltransferase